MMAIRCWSRLSASLFCLPLGLCVTSTAFGAYDDDDEEWHETKGPGGKKLDHDERPAKAKKADSDDEEKKADESKRATDDDAKKIGKNKRKLQRESYDLPSSTKLSFAALGTYGFPNPLQGGVGLRGGVHVQGIVPLYLGGVAEYFFGSQSTRRDLGGSSTRTARLMYFGAEGGVEVEATQELQIRPFIGLGLAYYEDKNCSTSRPCTNGSKIRPTLTPGITGLYYLGAFFLGADFRFLIVPGASTASGAVISGTLGVRL